MSWLDSVIQAGVAVAGAITAPPNATGGAKPAKGSAQIRAFVNRVLGGLDSLIQQTSSLSSSQKAQAGQQIMAQAQAIAGALSDGSQVYQAKRGDDAKILTDGKRDAGIKLQQLEQILTGQGSVTVNTLPTSGNLPTGLPTADGTTPVQQQQAMNNDILPLYLLGGGILLILLLKK